MLNYTKYTNNLEQVDSNSKALEDLLEIDKKIKDRVLESVKFAEESPFPTADEVYKDVYMQADYPYAQD